MEAITTLATIPAVLALVQLAKMWGVEGRWNMLLAVLLGVFIQVGEYAVYTVGAYSATGWYQAVATGLVLGLSASGLWDVAAKAGGATPVTVDDGAATVIDLDA